MKKYLKITSLMFGLVGSLIVLTPTITSCKNNSVIDSNIKKNYIPTINPANTIDPDAYKDVDVSFNLNIEGNEWKNVDIGSNIDGDYQLNQDSVFSNGVLDFSFLANENLWLKNYKLDQWINYPSLVSHEIVIDKPILSMNTKFTTDFSYISGARGKNVKHQWNCINRNVCIQGQSTTDKLNVLKANDDFFNKKYIDNPGEFNPNPFNIQSNFIPQNPINIDMTGIQYVKNADIRNVLQIKMTKNNNLKGQYNFESRLNFQHSVPLKPGEWPHFSINVLMRDYLDARLGENFELFSIDQYKNFTWNVPKNYIVM